MTWLVSQGYPVFFRVGILGYPGVSGGIRRKRLHMGGQAAGRNVVVQYVLQGFPKATLPGANLRRGILVGAPNAL